MAHRWWRLAVGGLVACRGWHDPIPFDECQPYPLECPACTLEDELALPEADLLRDWRCDVVPAEPDDGAEVRTLEAVRRRSANVPADDTHLYDADGVRVASVREHDDPIGVCGVETDEEWWGEIVDCAPRCEIDPSLPDADPTLSPCTP
ncbi:MAG: hypothetical protein ABMB14_29145 [Myxococcota bacterium]